MIEHQILNSRGNYNYNAFLYTDENYINHFHKNYELIYVAKGTAHIDINGKSNNLLQGDLLLISPYSIHGFSVNDRSEIWVGVFSEDYIHSFAKKHSYNIFSKFRCDKHLEIILKEYLFFEGQPKDLYMTKSCLYMICSECLKNSEIINTKVSNDFRNRVIEYISQNLTNDIRLFETATALGYEYHYFSSLFHQSFSLNFKEFVNMYRFEQSCEMLRDKEKDIAFVAVECGFQSIRNFNRIFKKFSGITPTEFRKTDSC